MDMQVRRSGLGLRSALGLVTLVSVALPALLVFGITISTYQCYYPPSPTPDYFVLDGPTYGPLTGPEMALTGFGALLLIAMIVSAMGLWSRFRRFAPILTVATTTVAVATGMDTVTCAWQLGSGCELLFHVDWHWGVAAGWACFVALVLRQVGRRPGALAPALQGQ